MGLLFTKELAITNMTERQRTYPATGRRLVQWLSTHREHIHDRPDRAVSGAKHRSDNTERRRRAELRWRDVASAAGPRHGESKSAR
jgi:hypothetical protein